MADVGYGPVPTNKIIVAGQPLTQILKVETATSVYPGRLVKKGTNDDDIVVNTAAGAAVGWAGYENTIKKHRPATVDTIYLINAQIAVEHGGHFVIVARLQTGQTITKGELLAAGATGTVQTGTAGTHHIVAIAEESVTTTSSESDIMVRSLL